MSMRRAAGNIRWILGTVGAVVGIAIMILLIRAVISPHVTVTEAVEGPVVQAFYSTGTVQPEREYPIKANSDGTITDVRVDKGDRVKKGDVLAIVSDPALKFAVDKAEAELHEKIARADQKTSPVLQEFDSKISAFGDLVDIAKREVNRISGLVEQSAGAQADLDSAMDRLKKNWSELEALKAQRASAQLLLQKDVEVAQSAVATARWNLDQQTLRSPIDGVVLERPTPLGTRVAVNDRITNVANVAPSSLVMRAAVDEEDVAKVRVDQTVRMTLYAFPARAFEGKVTRIYDQADPERRTFEVDVKLAEVEPHLQAGMTGELAFVMAEKRRAVVVPSQALQSGTIYIVKDGQLSRRDVTVGLKSVERVEVVSGINVGERVAISPIEGYSAEHRVRSTFMDPVVAAGLNKPPPIEQAFKAFQ